MPNLDPISIDITQIVNEFNLNQEQADSLANILLSQITDRIFYNWQNEAGKTLRSTRSEYLRNLNIINISKYKRAITLSGKFPNMLESGASTFDMKQGLLRSAKAKRGKNGKLYITVPFRHGTPGSIGESFAMRTMPLDVYQVVRKLQGTRTGLNNPVLQKISKLDINEIPAQYRIPKVRSAFSDIKTTTTYPQYTHKSSIYDGMTRQEKTYENATQSQYVTFRRVSLNSDPMSWIHHGIAAGNFAQKGLNKVDVVSLVDRTIDGFLNEIIQ